MDIEAFMFVPFGRETIVEDEAEQQKYKELSKQLVEEHPNEWGAKWAEECGIWNSHGFVDNLLLDHKEFAPLRDKIVKRVQAYADAISLDVENRGLELHESWLNANDPKNIQECHIHGYSFISGVYYVHNPEQGGDFVMDNPVSFEGGMPSTGTSPLDDKFSITPETGELILFPSNVDHHVTVNKSDERRFSLAFNVTTTNLVNAP